MPVHGSGYQDVLFSFERNIVLPFVVSPIVALIERLQNCIDM